MRNPVDRDIYRIAIPAFLGFLAFVMFDLVNIFWVGALGTSAVAGVAAAAFIQWAIFAAMNSTNVGCGTLVAQFSGAGKPEEARRTAVEAVWLGAGASLLIMAVLLPSAGWIFRLMGLKPQTALAAGRYLGIFVMALPLYYLCNLAGSVFNAHRETRTNVLIMSSSVALNMLLDPVLILGWGTGKPLGVAGAAAASVTATASALAVQTFIILRRGYLPAPKEILRRPPFVHAPRILSIGLPAAAVNMVWSLVYPALTAIITRFGEAPLAALSVCFRLEGVPYFLSMGFSTAMASLVGQAYGAGDLRRVREIASRGHLLITVLLAPAALAFVFFPHLLARPFTQDQAVLEHAAHYLRIVGYFEIFLGWELLFVGVFNGLGRTRPYMLICVPLTVARLPLAWFLSSAAGLGTQGIWWAVSASTLAKGLLLSGLFLRGRREARALTAVPAQADF